MCFVTRTFFRWLSPLLRSWRRVSLTASLLWSNTVAPSWALQAEARTYAKHLHNLFRPYVENSVDEGDGIIKQESKVEGIFCSKLRCGGWTGLRQRKSYLRSDEMVGDQYRHQPPCRDLPVHLRERSVSLLQLSEKVFHFSTLRLSCPEPVHLSFCCFLSSLRPLKWQLHQVGCMESFIMIQPVNKFESWKYKSVEV